MSGFQRLVLGSSVSLPSVFTQDVEIPTRAETSLKRNLDLCIDLLLCLFDRQTQFQFQPAAMLTATSAGSKGILHLLLQQKISAQSSRYILLVQRPLIFNSHLFFCLIKKKKNKPIHNLQMFSVAWRQCPVTQFGSYVPFSR